MKQEINNMLIDGDVLLEFLDVDQKEYTVPEGVRVISKDAFKYFLNGHWDFNGLHKYVFNLPDSVECIETEDFSGQSYIMNIPKGYLQRKEQLNEKSTYELLNHSWKSAVTPADLVYLYIYQKSKKIKEHCYPLICNRAYAAMPTFLGILRDDSKAENLTLTAKFVSEGYDRIKKEELDEFYSIVVAKKNKKALDIIKEVPKLAEELKERTGLSYNLEEIASDSEYKQGTIVLFGRYPQSEEVELEPIEWIVVSGMAKKSLLVSKKILDCSSYSANSFVKWEDSDMKKWLDDFYEKAFSEGEKKKISPHVIKGTYTNSEKDLKENVFILSKEELKKYFDLETDEYYAEGTEYALAKGLYTERQFSKAKVASETQGGWWLRADGPAASFVHPCWFDDGDKANINDTHLGVRPAVWVKK